MYDDLLGLMPQSDDDDSTTCMKPADEFSSTTKEYCAKIVDVFLESCCHWDNEEQEHEHHLISLEFNQGSPLQTCLKSLRPICVARPKARVANQASTVTAVSQGGLRIKAEMRAFPMPVVISVRIDGHQCNTLINSGSLTDFMSTTLADQLKVNLENKAQPLDLQMAIKGPHSKVNADCETRF